MMVDERDPVDRAVGPGALVGEVALEFSGGLVEVSAGGVVSSAAGGELAQLAGVGVFFEGDPDHTLGCGGEEQRSERTAHLRAGDPARLEDVPQRLCGKDGSGTFSEARLVVGAFGADAFGAGLDSLDREPTFREILETRDDGVEVEQSQAHPAAKVVVWSRVGLIANRLWYSERSEQPELCELGQRRVDRASA